MHHASMCCDALFVACRVHVCMYVRACTRMYVCASVLEAYMCPTHKAERISSFDHQPRALLMHIHQSTQHRYIYIYIYIYIHTCMHISIHIYIHAYTYVCMYVCMYACMHLCTYTPARTHTELPTYAVALGGRAAHTLIFRQEAMSRSFSALSCRLSSASA